MPKLTESSRPKRQLSLFDSACMIVGIIIGAGIYQTTPYIAGNVSSASGLILVWVLGGAVALTGAMCYAELTTSFPREGGDYVFLSQAYGRRAGFLFAWAEYWIVRPGNIGMLAFVFASYANQLLPLDPHIGDPLLRGASWVGIPESLIKPPQIAMTLYACGAIVLLTCINLLGVRSGKWTQNLLTVIKVVGLLAIFGAAAFLPGAPPSSASVLAAGAKPDFRIAIILVLFTYGGWNEMSYIAAEVRNPQKNLFRALLLGTVAVTLTYVLVNLAFVHLLGLDGVRQSKAIAAEMFRPHFGNYGARAMSALVCISCLGSINGMVFTGSRILYAVGTEHRFYAWLGRWNARFDAPVRALLIQVAVTVGLVIGFGWYADGFTNLLYFTTPVYWFFAFMVGISLFVLRHKKPDLPRPHQVVLYPWTPLLFCFFCAFLCESSLDYAIRNHDSWEAYVAIGLVAAGVVMSFFDPPRVKQPGANQ